MTTVVLVGTLDTKLADFQWMADELAASGCETIVIDAGTFSDDTSLATISAAEVAKAGGSTLDALRAGNDRNSAIVTMADGAASIVLDLFEKGQVDGFLSAGGSGGSALAATVMRALPIGVPKFLVSTMASGDVSHYIGSSDVTLMYSVADVSGINSISRRVYGNAVAGIAGMAAHYGATRMVPEEAEDRPLIGATMFGVTTPAVMEAKERLEELGYEVVVFHANGSGGRALEALVDNGFLAGVLDLTTTELADELVGGAFSAGPHRLEAAARRGVPQVVSLGALDMVNFGPKSTVPERFADRKFLVHNETVTLMRTTADELATLGGHIAKRLSTSTGPASVILPTGGFSAIDVPGGPFEDREADTAAIDALIAGLAGTAVAIDSVESCINDPGFGRLAADTLHELLTK